MNQYIPNYGTNSYVDKMFCIYCKNKHLCDRCGKKLFGNKSLNVYTQKIPPKIDFSYINSLFPSNYPYIYYYGSLNRHLINY